MAAGYESDVVYRLETNLDDCSAEILGSAMERLLAAGALDVWFTPIQMKKHRPGTMLSVLAEENARERLIDLVLTETSAFGLRVERIERVKLARRIETVTTPFGDIAVKLGLKGDRVVQVAPEYESVRAAAESSGKAVRVIFEAARRAWHDAHPQQF
jgi:uncharacterized protein (DUF111 family)